MTTMTRPRRAHDTRPLVRPQAAVRRGLARLLPSDENHPTAAAVEAQPRRRQSKGVRYARDLRARENFVRFYLADLLPAVERTLWLDADTVVRCDLSHLFAGAGAAPWHLEITRDHPRSPEITRDHPRSPEIALKAPPRGISRSQSSPWRCAMQRGRKGGLNETISTWFIEEPVSFSCVA